MADATYTTPVNDSVTAVDLMRTNINWAEQVVAYHLRETWSSGKTTERIGLVRLADFNAFLGSWVQATPKKKQLQWLAANAYEPNLTVN